VTKICSQHHPETADELYKNIVRTCGKKWSQTALQ